MIPAAEVRIALGLGAGDTSQDDLIQLHIGGVTALLGRELGRYLSTPTSRVETRRGGTPLIALHDDPSAGFTVTVRTRVGVTDAWEAVAGADYALEGRALRHPLTWPPFVEITYTAGYTVGAGPAELRALVRDLVTARVQRVGKEALRSESIGDYSYTLADFEGMEAWPSIASRWRRQLV